MAARPARILSLCSGIGGLDLGIAAALRGHCRTVALVEREGFNGALLATRAQEGWLDDAPVWSDIQSFDPQPWRGLVDAVIGSYPCQSISVAGKRKGTADDRWLWPHFARIIADVQPAWCFFENVAQHVNVGLDIVWTDLRRMGFDVEAGLFEAAEVGACHIRRRLFVYARRSTLRGDCTRRSSAEAAAPGGRQILADANIRSSATESREVCADSSSTKHRTAGISNEYFHGGEDVANPDSQCGRRRVGGAGRGEDASASKRQRSQVASSAASGCEDVADAHSPRPQINEGIRSNASEEQPTPERDCRKSGGGIDVANPHGKRGGEEQQGAWRWVADTDWRKRWESSAGILRISSGVPNRVGQLRALGNAVVPACAAFAFTTLAQRFRD